MTQEVLNWLLVAAITGVMLWTFYCERRICILRDVIDKLVETNGRIVDRIEVKMDEEVSPVAETKDGRPVPQRVLDELSGRRQKQDVEST